MQPVDRSVVDWLIFENKTISISDYQRPYVWSESHVTAFTENLLDTLFNNENGAPDIGVVIIESTPTGEFIADGQQRLLTFALIFVELCGIGLQGARKIHVRKNSRLNSLLNLSTGNLQTVIHARQARRIIRTILSGRQDLIQLRKKSSKTDLIKSLQRVTFSIVEFKRNSGDSSHPAITQFFEALNSTAKPLNGGQILKAYHMGRIVEKTPAETWALQSKYEAWFRQHKSNAKLKLGAFDPVIFNARIKNEHLSIERFIDSPGQDVRYKLGCGFVQAVQAIMLGQNEWWFSVSQQGTQRQLPYERLEGQEKTFRDEWNASAPLEFCKAQGFFSMIDRFGRLYTAYCQELINLPDCENWEIKTHILENPNSVTDLDRRPARLICKAARCLEACGQLLESWSNKESRLQAEEALGRFCCFSKDGTRENIAEGFLHAKSWLGIGPEGEDLHVTYGFIPTAIFASALAWSDRFSNHSADNDIVRILMLQLLFANVQVKSNSVLNALFMKETIESIHFSDHVQGAVWNFMRTARCKWDFIEWLRKLEELLTRILDESNPSESRLYEKEQEFKINSLINLRNTLSQYLSF